MLWTFSKESLRIYQRSECTVDNLPPGTRLGMKTWEPRHAKVERQSQRNKTKLKTVTQTVTVLSDSFYKTNGQSVVAQGTVKG